MDSGHKVSNSDHPLFRLALRYSTLFVRISGVYGIFLLAAALYILEWVPIAGVGFLGGELQQLDGAATNNVNRLRRAAALSLTTAGAMGLTVAIMVRRLCRFDPDLRTVRVNWHQLFKYTHMGRAIMAALTAVLTWRGLASLSEFRHPTGAVGRVPAMLIGGAILSMLTAASFHFLHFRLKAVYMETARIKRVATKRC